MRKVCCSQPNPERRRLKKIRDFLNKNWNWICESDCTKADPRCDICSMRLFINGSYSCNKSCTCKTFINSYLCGPFMKVEFLYQKHINFDRSAWSGPRPRRTVPAGKKYKLLYLYVIFYNKFTGKINT